MYLLCAMQKHVTKYIVDSVYRINLIATLHISPSLINHYTTNVMKLLRKYLTLALENASIVCIELTE